MDESFGWENNRGCWYTKSTEIPPFNERDKDGALTPEVYIAESMNDLAFKKDALDFPSQFQKHVKPFEGHLYNF